MAAIFSISLRYQSDFLLAGRTGVLIARTVKAENGSS